MRVQRKRVKKGGGPGIYAWVTVSLLRAVQQSGSLFECNKHYQSSSHTRSAVIILTENASRSPV